MYNEYILKLLKLFESKNSKAKLSVRKNSSGLMHSKTKIHKDKKKETSKKQARNKIKLINNYYD